MANIGDVIRTLREEKGVTAKDLAARIGLSPSQMSRLESGQRRVNSEVLARIARALEVTPSQFFDEGGSIQVLPLSRSAATPLRSAIGKIFRSARRQKHWTVEDFARKTSVSRAYCISVEEGRRSGLESDFVRKACRVLGLSPLDLLFSIEEKLDVEEIDSGHTAIPAVTDRNQQPGIPLIASETTAYPEDLDDRGMPEGVVEDWLQLPGINPGRTFALRVAGEAMAGVGEDCFRAGDVVVFSPDQAVTNGDLALVRTTWQGRKSEKTSRTVFCRYFADDLQAIRLQFLRSEFPPYILPASEVERTWGLVLHLRAPENGNSDS
ncbi:MAG: LexA family transcriptional regulator [Planctomycetota bacterium]